MPTNLDAAKVETLPPIIAGSVVASRPVKVVPPPPRPKPDWMRGRGPLVAAAIALALVVLVMSVLLIVLRDDDEPDGNQAAPAPSTTVPAAGAPATSAAGSTAGAAEPTGQPVEPTVAPPSNPTGPGTTKRPVPSSWRMYTGKSGFRVPVPPGMTATIEGTRVNFSGGGRLLIIDQRDDPQPDPVADWKRQESYRVANGDWAGYQKIGIVEVDYFQKAADWDGRTPPRAAPGFTCSTAGSSPGRSRRTASTGRRRIPGGLRVGPTYRSSSTTSCRTRYSRGSSGVFMRCRRR